MIRRAFVDSRLRAYKYIAIRQLRRERCIVRFNVKVNERDCQIWHMISSCIATSNGRDIYA